MSPSASRTSTGTTPKKVEDLSYEAAFSELEAIVIALESEGHPLDESLSLYERGQVLATYCALLLEKAELKVRALGSDGQVEVEGQD